jgi:hypothetical protein
MKRGTKSLLWGAHCMLWHPLIVAFCWWKLYGFPWNPKLWLCFFLHDIGYYGRETMDGEGIKGGKWHPLLGAVTIGNILGVKWELFCLLHSRSIAEYYRKIFKPIPGVFDPNRIQISKLCVADKLAVKYTPLCLFNKDELEEYLTNGGPYLDKYDWKAKMAIWSEDFAKDNKDIAYDVSDYLN